MSLAALLAGLATPHYMDAVEKRRIATNAESIQAFIGLTRSEAIKRSEELTVSYSLAKDGNWCMGSVLGTDPCDCRATREDRTKRCLIDGETWVMSDRDLPAPGRVETAAGDGAYTLDPVRGVLADPADTFRFAVTERSAGHDFEVRLELLPTGHSRLCVPAGNPPLSGIATCRDPG